MILIFTIGMYLLISYRLNLKKAAEITEEAVYPRNKDEFETILVSGEWKEMSPLTKMSRSYKLVHWGTIGALIVTGVLLAIIVYTDWLNISIFNVIYLFLFFTTSIRHKGNFYIVPDGIVLNGRYFPVGTIKKYTVEKIVRWHELYGLHDRMNNGYKLQFHMKGIPFMQTYVIIEDQIHLDKITSHLEHLRLEGEIIKEKNSRFG